ncbi:PREDICTED: 60S acidic ribosomal protein P2-like, partial [Drosophila arizonae]|uniref:Large ribosomal subunit protein P2 n=1 Tax=Drosophila arizonae TaxID=7263 RepID=A0ABM1P7C9_DROAR
CNFCAFYVVAYLLAVRGGQDGPANEDLKKILNSVDMDIKELKGKSIDYLIKENREQLSSMPVGGVDDVMSFALFE